MPIQILADEVASQIAAGEVVERPASVVKELIENALDAEASHVSVTIEDAGKKLIEVADNGAGIPADELPLAVARHATSKLSTAEDLFRIATLGFRGEALASIGSVSRMTITSRTRQADVGMRLRVDGGHAEQPEPVGAPAGTLVRVESLFYNVPARLKFLKTDRTERRHIKTLVTHYALAYPNVRFQLTHGGRQILQTSGNGDRREILATIYELDIARKMIEVIAEFEHVGISGYTSPPSVNRSNRSKILFFVNGRPVQDIALTTALVKAYHNMLMVGRYPMAAMFLDIPPERVDVNVHPTKAEIRFRDRDEIFRAVGRAVRRALMAHTPVPEMDDLSERMRRASTSLAGDSPSRQVDPAWGLAAQVEGLPSRPDSGDQPPGTPSQESLPKTDVPLLRLVGQIATTYLVAEGPDGLYLIDQHAAHERILFEKFMAARDEKIPSQTLMEPVSVELPPAEADLIEEQIPVLEKLGFQVELFGRDTFLVRALPTLLAEMEPAAALRVLVEDFEEDESPLADKIEAKVIARVCKRAAIKAGKALAPEEQQALLRDLEACRSPRTCPHGRPTMIHLSVDLLERQFGRKGAR
jgi:DNA mismatch repair protein MutL